MTVAAHVLPEPDSWPAPARIVERIVPLAGFRTRVLEVEGDGPPILLLHGFTDSADTWRALLASFAERGRSAVAVDLPGHGRASRPHRGPLVPQLVEFAAAAARWTGERPVVVGNSLGGLTALLLAADGREELTGVVPVSPAGFDHAAWLQLGALPMRLPVAPLLASAYTLVPGLVLEPVLRRLITSLSGCGSWVDAAFPAAYARHLAGRAARRCTVDMLGRLAREVIGVTVPLAAVGCPVMLLWGDRDPVTPSSGARRLAAALPGVRHEVLERAGHLPQLERPGAIADLIEDFAPAGGWEAEVAPAG
jgi:pimeloyl-ACP methyl ester carboxylesterase